MRFRMRVDEDGMIMAAELTMQAQVYVLTRPPGWSKLLLIKQLSQLHVMLDPNS